MAAELTRDAVFESINSIFTSMLGLELQTSDGAPQSAPGAIKITASVGMAGDWNGTALLECSSEMACTMAGAMLMSEFDQVDDDVKDVMGEITNMFAGNVARLLPGSSALSPPCVVLGSEYSMEILKSRKAVKLPVTCNGKDLLVSVVAGAKG